MLKRIFKHAGKATATEVLIPQKLKLQKESEAFNGMGKLTSEPNFLEKWYGFLSPIVFTSSLDTFLKKV